MLRKTIEFLLITVGFIGVASGLAMKMNNMVEHPYKTEVSTFEQIISHPNVDNYATVVGGVVAAGGLALGYRRRFRV